MQTFQIRRRPLFAVMSAGDEGKVSGVQDDGNSKDKALEETIYPKPTGSEFDVPPPKYHEADDSFAAVQQAHAADDHPYTRYDTLTSYAGIETQYGTGSIKIDPNAVEPASFIVARNALAGALDEPFPVQCPFCHSLVNTKIVHVSGCMTYLVCLATGVFTSFLGCCLIPFCMNRFKDVKHYCPQCDQLIAIYKRL